MTLMEEIKIKLPSGKFRIKNAQCPRGCSLMSTDKLINNYPTIVVLARVRGKSSKIYFNPFYGTHEYECNMKLKKGEKLEICCPHCNASMAIEKPCSACGASMFAIHLADQSELIMCPTVGCQNHELTLVDLDAQFAAFYEEERRPRM